jgi:hypothetical protein
MTLLSDTPHGDAHEPSDAHGLAGPDALITPGRSRTRCLVRTAALLLPLVGIVIVLVLVFQPFANAAGGCGGG